MQTTAKITATAKALAPLALAVLLVKVVPTSSDLIKAAQVLVLFALAVRATQKAPLLADYFAALRQCTRSPISTRRA
ncbi:hypothetical protein [Quatrionicoccus australiensis]|uniref:hypothetical protein n=1 Tax=Quatrionicoccus australiensis TaxID=138118 RepID=UPI001CFA39A7|nr:hypothetical protein [Quatrionicoccus australiensis]MCB4359578.1 hypothetical protein [Quatrionicoccus australiensis]